MGYSGIRFVISKKGTGRAVLAQMQVKSKNDCTAPPLELKAQRLGTPCSLAGGGDECTSGICCDGLCSECCLDSRSREFFPNDAGSALSQEIACPGGGTCARRADVTFSFIPTTPLQCDLGKGKRAAGGECIAPADCTSGICEGTLWRADENNSRVGSCPPSFPETGLGCDVAAVRAGRCK